MGSITPVLYAGVTAWAAALPTVVIPAVAVTKSFIFKLTSLIVSIVLLIVVLMLTRSVLRSLSSFLIAIFFDPPSSVGMLGYTFKSARDLIPTKTIPSAIE